MPRFTLQDDDDDEPADSNSQGENEPPHPLGFATPPPGAISPGRSRYGLHLDEEDEAEDWLERKAIAPRTYPLLSSYLQTGVSTTPMKVLVRDAYLDAAQNQTADDDEQDDGLDGLTDVLQVIRLSKPSSGTPLALQQTAAAPQDLTYYKVDRYNEVCRGRIAEYAKKLEHGNQSLAHSLQKYIDKQRLEAERIREEQRRQQEEEEEAKREADRVAREEEEIQQKKDQAEADKKEAEVKAAKVKADAASSAKQKVKADQDAKEKAENEYIYKAEKLVSRLVELRANVETFEKSKPMSKRRLSMKKVVNGRVNTLSEDAGKIRLVAADVNAAVAQARQDDLQVKAQLEAGNPQYSAEMARGKRYFSDLLASKVIVRVQAEGFNG
jgi:DNA repair exonuclease SbcCD ATPase subunit